MPEQYCPRTELRRDVIEHCIARRAGRGFGAHAAAVHRDRAHGHGVEAEFPELLGGPVGDRCAAGLQPMVDDDGAHPAPVGAREVHRDRSERQGIGTAAACHEDQWERSGACLRFVVVRGIC